MLGDEYERLLEGVELEAVEVKEIGHGYSRSNKKKSHPIVLARKPTAHDKCM